MTGPKLRIVAETGDRWWQRADCRDAADPELWHPEKGMSAQPARRICYGCPVREECLLDAVQSGDQWSVRGGMTGRERRGLSVRDGMIVTIATARAAG